MLGITGVAVLTLTAWFGPNDGRDLAPTDLERIQAGMPAPDFVLPDGAGRAFSLSGFRGRNLVLVFYRGHW